MKQTCCFYKNAVAFDIDGISRKYIIKRYGNVWMRCNGEDIIIGIYTNADYNKAIRILKANLPIRRIKNTLIASRMKTSITMDIINNIVNGLHKFKLED